MATSYLQARTNSYRSGTHFSNGTTTQTIGEDRVSWSDTRTPESKNSRRRWQIRQHENAATEMGFTYQTYQRGSCNAWCKFGPVGTDNERFLTGEAYASPPFPVAGDMISGLGVEGCSQIASQKLMLQGRKAQTQLQSLVSLGEFGETVRMLRNPAKALFSGIRDYMKSARRRAGRVKKKHRNRVVQDTWLEYQFGWRPLVSDIEGAYSALHDMPTSRFQHVRASHSDTGTSATTFGSTTNGIFTFSYENRKVSNVSVRAYGEVRVDCTTPSGSLARWGLRTSEFAPTVWELIPYSFVVDYFSNIGDAIAAATFPSSNWAWHGMTSRNRVTATRIYSFNKSDTMSNEGGDAKDAGGTLSSSKAERTVVYRRTAAYTGSRVFKLQFEIPGLSLKWLNLAALR